MVSLAMGGMLYTDGVVFAGRTAGGEIHRGPNHTGSRRGDQPLHANVLPTLVPFFQLKGLWRLAIVLYR